MTFVVEDTLADLIGEVQRLNAGQDATRGALAKLGLSLESLACVQGDIKRDLAAIRADNHQKGAAIAASLEAIMELLQMSDRKADAVRSHLAGVTLLHAMGGIGRPEADFD
jgi:hypothetical protein